MSQVPKTETYRVRSKSFNESFADYDAISALDAGYQHMDELRLPNKEAHKFEVSRTDKPFLLEWESVDTLIAKERDYDKQY